jgi:hypothetical protein
MANSLRSLLRDFAIAAAVFDRQITEIPDDDTQVVQNLVFQFVVALNNAGGAPEDASALTLAAGTFVTVQYRRGGAYYCTDVPLIGLIALSMQKDPERWFGILAGGALDHVATVGASTATWRIPIALADLRIPTADGEVSLHEIETIRVRCPVAITYDTNTTATAYTLTVSAEVRHAASPFFGARPIVQTRTTDDSPVTFSGNAYKLIVANFNVADAARQVTGTVNGASTHQGATLAEIGALLAPFTGIPLVSCLHGFGADSLKDAAMAASFQYAPVVANAVNYYMESIEPVASTLPARVRSSAELESARANPLLRGQTMPKGYHAGLVPARAKRGR